MLPLGGAGRHEQTAGASGARAVLQSRQSRAMPPVISISHLTKTYASGLHALKRIDLEIRKGEIFALLGPNGAGKTTLINIVCGIVTPGAGVVLVDGHDIAREYRAARAKIGLVPQELTTDTFETVWATVTFSRGLFGRAANPALIERVLRDLSLWEKRNNKIMTLSGGMKRRVLIAKALAHEPEILFLDEPTAGVDVELRRDMWALVRALRAGGVTIILTTHYLEPAGEPMRVQPARRLGHLQVRDGAGAPHAPPERGDAGHHHLALFRRLRRGDRVARDRGERRRLRRLHRAGAGHAVAVHAEHLQ